jgi:hypothetical protein
MLEPESVILFSDSKHIKSGLVAGILKSTWRAMLARDWQGDPKQQGGSIVVAAGKVMEGRVQPYDKVLRCS